MQQDAPVSTILLQENSFKPAFISGLFFIQHDNIAIATIKPNAGTAAISSADEFAAMCHSCVIFSLYTSLHPRYTQPIGVTPDRCAGWQQRAHRPDFERCSPIFPSLSPFQGFLARFDQRAFFCPVQTQM
jgi:hypothetical protein